MPLCCHATPIENTRHPVLTDVKLCCVSRHACFNLAVVPLSPFLRTQTHACDLVLKQHRTLGYFWHVLSFPFAYSLAQCKYLCGVSCGYACTLGCLYGDVLHCSCHSQACTAKQKGKRVGVCAGSIHVCFEYPQQDELVNMCAPTFNIVETPLPCVPYHPFVLKTQTACLQ